MRTLIIIIALAMLAFPAFAQMDPAAVLQQAQKSDLGKILDAQQRFVAANQAAVNAFNDQQAVANRIVQNARGLPMLQQQQSFAVANQIRINAAYQLNAARQQSLMQLQADRLGFYPQGAK